MKRKYNYNIALVLGMLVGFWTYMTALSKERCSIFFNSAGSTTSAIASHMSTTKQIHYTKGLSISAKLQCSWIVISATSLSLTSKIALQWILAQLAAQESNLVLLDCGNWEHTAHQSNKWMYYNRKKANINTKILKLSITCHTQSCSCLWTQQHLILFLLFKPFPPHHACLPVTQVS